MKRTVPILTGIICLAGICLGEDKTGSLVVSPGSDVSWPCSLKPFETANLTITIAEVSNYRVKEGYPVVVITSNNPNFFWSGGYSVVNSAGISAVTTVKVKCKWEPIPGTGGGGGTPPPPLEGSATGIASAQPGQYWNEADVNVIAVGNSVTVHAKKTNNEPAPSSWSASGSVSVGGGGASATGTGTAPSTEEYDGVVTSTSNECGKSDTEAFTVVGVVSIEAEPDVVCLGNTNVSFKITTQPEGYNHMVSYTRPDLSTPGIKEVVATCGNSAATCEVTVVKVEITSGFARVAPTRTQMVSVVTYPSPLPSGVSAILTVERSAGGEGSADVVPGTITCSTNVSVVGGQQSWGAGNTPAPNNMALVASIGNYSVTSDMPFTVCSHPVDFTQITASTLAEGVLYFEYGWLSDSDYVEHLDRVWVGEYII